MIRALSTLAGAVVAVGVVVVLAVTYYSPEAPHAHVPRSRF